MITVGGVLAKRSTRESAYARRSGLPPAPPAVRLVDDASDSATVVEVHAGDALGVLHRITAALAATGLDVRTAHISTLGADAVDAFYVVGPDGGEPAKAILPPPVGLLLAAVPLGVVAMFGWVLAASPLLFGAGWRPAALGFAVGTLSTVALVLYWRAKVSPIQRRRFGRHREAKAHHVAVLARSAVLWRQLRPTLAPDLPLPPARQPTHFAVRMYARRGVGGDPEALLRALPANASPYRVLYLRYVVRGGVVTLLLLAGVLLWFGARFAFELAD